MHRGQAMMWAGSRWASGAVLGVCTLLLSEAQIGAFLNLMMPERLERGDEFLAIHGSLELVQAMLQIALAIVVTTTLMRVSDRRRRTGCGLVVIGALASLCVLIFLTELETPDGELLGIVVYVLVVSGVHWQIVLAICLLTPPVFLLWRWYLVRNTLAASGTPK